MNKYLMKTIDYQEWKIELYQWFAKKRFEIICHSPTGNKLDYSKISMRCWFNEDFAIDEAKEFIDLIISQQNINPITVSKSKWNHFELAETQQVDLSKLAG
ncbi:hypothetical protein [Anabaena catenula]|uniref:Uncharacterized protein n=1 Tax=Anabaena catenula FACHB-362 TaxID=2692877 RepID=A0ABR8J2X5_9NOST|nr:hypothetical protein [Anabaena catenula]MBD2691950.1 hypothetical protein [Anabaena catenula FACHB-362]